MAPEQYGAALLVDGSKIDVFALGVIAFECFMGGMHPIGERTADVWPKRSNGKQPKWDREDVWKNWASRPKDLAALTAVTDLPTRFLRLIAASLSADPAARPDMEEFENGLWLSLKDLSPDWAKGIRMQIEASFDSCAPSGQPHEWPYMDECVAELRTFYSKMP